MSRFENIQAINLARSLIDIGLRPGQAIGLACNVFNLADPDVVSYVVILFATH